MHLTDVHGQINIEKQNDSLIIYFGHTSAPYTQKRINGLVYHLDYMGNIGAIEIEDVVEHLYKHGAPTCLCGSELLCPDCEPVDDPKCGCGCDMICDNCNPPDQICSYCDEDLICPKCDND